MFHCTGCGRVHPLRVMSAAQLLGDLCQSKGERVEYMKRN